MLKHIGEGKNPLFDIIGLIGIIIFSLLFSVFCGIIAMILFIHGLYFYTVFYMN